MSEDAWNRYFYPETLNDPVPVMKNLFDLRNAEQLQRREFYKTSLRSEELRAHPELVPRTFDADHLRGIHRHLFQDLYEWAGEDREVIMGKNGHMFAVPDTRFVMTAFGPVYPMQDYLREAQKTIAETRWESLSKTEFTEKMSAVFSNVNHAHPFREGNGRTTKIFLEHISEKTPFRMQWNRIPADVWNQRSMFSSPQPGQRSVNPEEIAPVFRLITTEREA